MNMNVTEKLIDEHLVDGVAEAGEVISLNIDQTLCQDATGTLVMLTLEAMELDKVKTECSVQYVDHNLLQEDHKNPDDHSYLRYAAQRFGLYYSRAGNGISHPLHTQYFAKPGNTLIGSDSHTCANGCMGMLAIGTGGSDVAMAMAGKPLQIAMPEVHGVELTGELPDFVSAKDIILELLRRLGVEGGVGKIFEYFGSGLSNLDVWDRHVIANMGAELGATASVFPADSQVKNFLESAGRTADWRELGADKTCHYHSIETIDLSQLEPLIAKPSSPDNVVPVSEVVGEPIQQAYIGSSANPSHRDFAAVADIVAGQNIPEEVSLDINPSSRNLLMQLTKDGRLASLLEVGARLHQTGCNGCIGMGQAPATNANSLRTTPRNFPGRSGTLDDKVWLCSPETAAASARYGKITDPRTLSIIPAKIDSHDYVNDKHSLFLEPSEHDIAFLEAAHSRGPNIAPLPDLEPIADQLQLPILLNLEDNISTDGILPAGAEVLPYRSNIPKIAEFAFKALSSDYFVRAETAKLTTGHAIVAGRNYGQGSSREHAALALAYLGLKIVIAQSYARIHFQNLINFGVLPLKFNNAALKKSMQQGYHIRLNDIHESIRDAEHIEAIIAETEEEIRLELNLSQRQREMVLAGGIIPWSKLQNV